jgi:hypothetical protein
VLNKRFEGPQFVYISRGRMEGKYLTALFMLPLIPLSTTLLSNQGMFFSSRPFMICSLALLAVFSPNASQSAICAQPNAHAAAPRIHIPMTNGVICFCKSLPDIPALENAPSEVNISPRSIVNTGVRNPDAIDVQIAGISIAKSWRVQNRYSPLYDGFGAFSSIIS